MPARQALVMSAEDIVVLGVAGGVPRNSKKDALRNFDDIYEDIMTLVPYTCTFNVAKPSIISVFRLPVYAYVIPGH